MFFIITLAVFASVLFVAEFVIRKASKIISFCKKHYKPLFVLAFLVLLAVQIWLVASIYSMQGWDVGMVYNTATSPNMGEWTNYYERYPNNVFLLFLFRAIIILQGALDIKLVPWLTLGIINAVAVNIAVVLLVLFAKKLFGFKMAALVYGLSFVQLGLSPWLMVPYSDTLTMPFVVAIVYFYYLLCNAKGRIKYLYCVIIGVSATVGFLLKPSVIIMLIAVCLVHLVWQLAKAKELLKHIKYAAAIGLSMLVLFSGFNLLVAKQTMIKLDESRAAPLSHWFMMGMDSVPHPVDGLPQFGGWSHDDGELTFAENETTEEMDKVCKQEIAARFKEFGFFGYLKFLAQKAGWIMGDGSFFWDREGYFAQYDYGNDNFFKLMFYPLNANYDFYIYASEAFWMLLLLGVALSGVFARKRKGLKYMSVLKVAVFGLILFLLLFEGRSRYLLHYMPIIIFIAADGYLGFLDFVKRKKTLKRFPLFEKS